MLNHRYFPFLLTCTLALVAWAQDEPPPVASPSPAHEQSTDVTAPSERWNLFYQATSIGQYHGKFHASYRGPLSLSSETEREVSLTATIFLGFRLGKDTQLYFDPELAGGRGFSGVNGLANPTTAELPPV